MKYKIILLQLSKIIKSITIRNISTNRINNELLNKTKPSLSTKTKPSLSTKTKPSLSTKTKPSLSTSTNKMKSGKTRIKSKSNRFTSQFTFNTKYPNSTSTSKSNRSSTSKSNRSSTSKSNRSSTSKSIKTSIILPAKWKLEKSSNKNATKNNENATTRHKNNENATTRHKNNENATTRHKNNENATTRNKNNENATTRHKNNENATTRNKNTIQKTSSNDKFELVEKKLLNSWFINDNHDHGSSTINHNNQLLNSSNHGRIWPDYQFLPTVMNTIKYGLKFSHPSPVQVAFLSCCQKTRKNILCGSQTGSGKTAAYLIALFEELKRQELPLLTPSQSSTDVVDATTSHSSTEQSQLQELDLDIEAALEKMNFNQDPDSVADHDITHNDTSLIAPSIRKVKRPRAIILVPSRHLVQQVSLVAKEMSHHCRLRVVGLHSKTKHARESFQEDPIDILITTPTTLLHLIEEEGFSFSQLQKLVLDEADTLFDKNFLPETSKIIKQIQALSANRKEFMTPCYLFTATFPQTLNQTISTLFPPETDQELIRLTTPSLHRPVKSVHHSFYRLNQSVTKNNLLVESIKKSRDSTKRILVFCNTQETAQQVYSFLKDDKKLPNVVLLSSHLPLPLLKKNLDHFMGTEEELVIAISTDLASRGLDTLQVGHVINYDFPLTVMDYVHRSGRTGRYGRSGRCTSFLEKRDGRLGSEIEEKIKRGVSL